MLSVELLRADGLAPPDPDVHTGKRKASDGSAEDQREEGDNSDEGDEAQLKALMVCPPSLPAHAVDIDRGLFQEQMNKIQAKLRKKAAKSKPAKKIKTENFRPLLAGEVIDLTID